MSRLTFAAIWLLNGAVVFGADVDTLNFGYTGDLQSFTVPDGVTSMRVDLIGAKGGSLWDSDRFSYYQLCDGGYGGRVQATFGVAPGEVYFVAVGDTGGVGDGDLGFTTGGYNGGGAGGGEEGSGDVGGAGGGGATDIRTSDSPTDFLSSRLATAGGGGGCALTGCAFHTKGGYGGFVAGTPRAPWQQVLMAVKVVWEWVPALLTMAVAEVAVTMVVEVQCMNAQAVVLVTVRVA